MFVEEIRRAVQACQRGRLPELSAAVWKSFAAGAVSEDEAQGLAELIETRKAAGLIHLGETSRQRVGSRPRSSASLKRRRSWAASSWLPPRLAAQFTQAEAAALGVVLSEIALRGRCELCHGAVAGRAGMSVASVKRALTQARRLGLLHIEERRVSRFRNLPNAVTIASAELSTWVATRARGLRAAMRQGGGVQTGTAAESMNLNNPARPVATAGKAGLSMREVARFGPIGQHLDRNLPRERNQKIAISSTPAAMSVPPMTRARFSRCTSKPMSPK